MISWIGNLITSQELALVVSSLSALIAIAVTIWLSRRSLQQETINRQVLYVAERQLRNRENHSTGQLVWESENPEFGLILRRLGRLEDQLGSLKSFDERLFSSTVNTTALIDRLQIELDNRLSAISDQLSDSKLDQLPAPQSVSPISLAAETKLVREMSHTLLTPLSRIDAISKLLGATIETPDIVKPLRSIQAAVSICVLYLQAFRALSHLSVQSSAQGVPFAQALHSAASLYSEAANKSVEFQINAPSRINGVPEYLLLASILPLVENAIDAVTTGGAVAIEITEEPSLVTAKVANLITGDLPEKNLFEDGYTTKIEPIVGQQTRLHEGLGLGIARNLVQSIPGGTVNYRLRQGEIVFTISIPVRR